MADETVFVLLIMMKGAKSVKLIRILRTEHVFLAICPIMWRKIVCADKRTIVQKKVVSSQIDNKT